MRRLDQVSGQVDVSLFGMHCRFTAHVLAALINAGHKVNLVVLPRHSEPGVQVMLPPAMRPRISLIATDSTPAVLPNVAALAWSTGAALVEASRDELDSLPRRFATLRKGLIISACFPWRLPGSVLDMPEQGALNVHPSLLPLHRGPDPLFWTFHGGDRQSGVTIHRMTVSLDAGPVLAQRALPLALESRYREVEREAIEHGADLLVEVVDELLAGELVERAQSDVVPKYEGHPSAADLVASTAWPAERGYRFVHGAGPDYGPIAVELAHGDRLQVRDAVRLHPDRKLGAPMKRHGSLIAVQFSDGVVTFQPAGRL